MRMIVCLGDDEKKLSSTWNRAYTLEERKLVFNLALQVEDWLRHDLHVPAIQIVYAANNAHSEVILMGEQEGEQEQFLLGNLKEPLMLHVHLICRGIIGKEYFPGLPLTGPRPGEVFDLRGNGSPTEGQKKLSWKPKERQLLQQWLQKKFQTLL